VIDKVVSKAVERYLASNQERTVVHDRPQRHQSQNLQHHRQRPSNATSDSHLKRLLPVNLALERDSVSSDGEGGSEREGDEERGEKMEVGEGYGELGRDGKGGEGEEGRSEGKESEGERLLEGKKKNVGVQFEKRRGKAETANRNRRGWDQGSRKKGKACSQSESR
jgi:hypothetical protein